MEILQTLLQCIIALGIFNVWFIRNSKSTAYRGGNATNIKEEFATYGFSTNVMYTVGFLKVSCAIALLLGIWVHAMVAPAAGLLALLMVGAILMHLKIKDPISKAMPAVAMLLLCLAVLLLA